MDANILALSIFIVPVLYCRAEELKVRLGVETIRFYEPEGPIAEPPRRASGYTQYPPDTVYHVLFIKRTKEVEFLLREIGGPLDLRLSSKATAADVRKRAVANIDHITARIRCLQRMKRKLDKLARASSGKGSVSECPVLEALEGRRKSSSSLPSRA